MIPLFDKSKISILNYFYVFCIFIYAGSATVFVRDLGDIRTVGNAFALIITLIFFRVNKIRFTRPYYISIAVFLLYAVVTSINNRMVNPRWISEWIIWLTMAYGLCQGFKEKLFVVVETVLCHLSVIALVFWVIHVINPTLITNFVQTYAFSEPYEEDCNVMANMIFYTVNDIDENAEHEFELLLRNAGFAWEPGAFASFACLGIFCNILRTNFKLMNPSLWILTLALASTQSTTGFLIFLLIVVIWLVLNKKYVFLLILIPGIIFVFNLPFVKEKLFDEIDNLQYADYTILSGSLGRLYSFQLNFEEFLRHPLIGLGGYSQGTWLEQHGYDVITISGIGHMLVYFGAVMTALFIYLLVKSCKYIQEVTKSNNAWILIAVMLGTMVSYNLWKQPIYIAFWMYGVYASENDKPKKPNILKRLFKKRCSI